MRTSIRVGGVIQADASSIFACLSDYRQAPVFIHGLETLEPAGGGGTGQGASFDAVVRLGPKTYKETIVLSTLETDRRVTWSSHNNEARSVTFTLTPAEEGTKVVMEVAYEPPAGLAGALTAPVIEQTVRARAHASMRRLRDHVT